MSDLQLLLGQINNLLITALKLVLFVATQHQVIRHERDPTVGSLALLTLGVLRSRRLERVLPQTHVTQRLEMKELDERVQIVEAVVDRRAGHGDAVLGLETADHFAADCGMVLDAVRLV